MTTAHDIADAFSTKSGKILPWFTVRETIESAFRARLLERTLDSAPWPSDYAGARAVRIRKVQEQPSRTEPTQQDYTIVTPKKLVQELSKPYTLHAEAKLEIYE